MVFPVNLKAKFIKELEADKIPYTNGWGNYMGNVNNPAALVIEITSVEQLQSIIKKIKVLNDSPATKDKIYIRATAGWSDEPVNKCCFFPTWAQTQLAEYNEAYSFSEVVGGRATPETPGTDIILRFAKKFHEMEVIGPLPPQQQTNPTSPIHQLPGSLVKVSAGVQIAELVEFLRSKNLSLTTVSMISWVSAVGLAGTGGHGTGRDEPAFSGLIESLEVCDMEGNIREINRLHPDFETLVAAHSGLLGVVTSMKIRAVQGFNLRETIDLYSRARDMEGNLDETLQNNQYVSIMGMPTYSLGGSQVARWQIRKWNHTTENPQSSVPAPYKDDAVSFNQQLQVELGDSTLSFLIDSGLKQLLPAFMVLSAAMITGGRGNAAVVGFENNITHPQVAFPKEMRDVSYLIPVKDAEAGAKLEMILKKFEEILNEGAKRGEFPVTYAVYVRYFKGTKKGLSPTSCEDDERILAIDIVTHPEAPGISNFEQQFLKFLADNGLKPRHHLGKNFPAGVERYSQFLEEGEMVNYIQALTRWHTTPGLKDGLQKLNNSPYVSPYMEKMLTPAKPLELMHDAAPRTRDRPHKDHPRTAQHDFLTRLHAGVQKRAAPTQAASEAQAHFLRVCQEEIDKLGLEIAQQPQPT